MGNFDLWDGVTFALKKAVPVLGNAILPGAGGVAASLITEVFACGDDPESIKFAVEHATPEQLDHLKRLAAGREDELKALATKQRKYYVRRKRGENRRKKAAELEAKLQGQLIDRYNQLLKEIDDFCCQCRYISAWGPIDMECFPECCEFYRFGFHEIHE